MSHPLCKGKTPHIYSGIYLDAGKLCSVTAMEAIVRAHQAFRRFYPSFAPVTLQRVPTPLSARPTRHRPSFGAWHRACCERAQPLRVHPVANPHRQGGPRCCRFSR